MMEAHVTVKGRCDDEENEAGHALDDRRPVRSRHAAFAAAIMCLGALPLSPPLMAQGVDCQTLRARIEASSGADARTGQYASTLRRQQYELQRAQAYADSIGCNADFMFNSSQGQCDAIASRIERLQETVGQLQQQMQDGGDGGDRTRALTEQYNAYCAGLGPEPRVEDTPPDRRLLPVDPDAEPPPEDDGSPPVASRPHRVRALCVRECDGGFFPITDDASSEALDDFDRLCKAMCPNTKASLYTAAPSADIETAVAADGTPYTDLPAAFKFQKSFDATCSCKPPHQSWVEALAAAEALIETGHGDVIVTQRMSDAMSRPGLPKPGKPAPASKPLAKTKSARQLDLPPPPAIEPPNLDDQGTGRAPDALDGDLTRQLRRDAPTL